MGDTLQPCWIRKNVVSRQLGKYLTLGKPQLAFPASSLPISRKFSQAGSPSPNLPPELQRSRRPTCTTGLIRSQAVKAIPALANPIHWAVSLFPSSPGTAHCCMCLYVIAEHFIFWLNFCRAVEYSDISSCSVQIKDWGWTSWKWRICVPSQSVFPSGMCSNCP